jgi:hypothetical protein
MKVPTLWRALWYLVLLAVLTLASVLYTLSWVQGDALKVYGLDKDRQEHTHDAKPVADVSEESNGIPQAQGHDHDSTSPGSGGEQGQSQGTEHEHIQHANGTAQGPHNPTLFQPVSLPDSDLKPEVGSHSSQSGNEPHVPSLSQPSIPPPKHGKDAHDAVAGQVPEAGKQ